jgi:hypothetical protein
VGVAVSVFQAGLVHVLMRVLGSVVVRVVVLMCDVVVLMRGVCVGMRRFAVLMLVLVLVLVCVGRVVGVLLGHSFSPCAKYRVFEGCSPGAVMRSGIRRLRRF